MGLFPMNVGGGGTDDISNYSIVQHEIGGSGYKSSITINDLVNGADYLLVNRGQSAGVSASTEYTITNGTLLHHTTTGNGGSVLLQFKANSTSVTITSQTNNFYSCDLYIHN